MDYIQPFSLKEYYLWRRNIGAEVPWKREYLNRDFLKYEQARIAKLSEWHKKFLKTEENKKLEEASFYTIPLELSPSWKGSIASLGNFNFVGLSALQNSPQVILLALIPSELKQPTDYRLINIIKSKKMHVINEKMINERMLPVEPAVIIEEWEYLPSDAVYVDIPYEKKIIQKMLKESGLIGENLSLSLQSPVLSAPFIVGSVGGISLSSITDNGVFAREFIKTTQLIVPPEYRRLNPPKDVYVGSKIPHLPGIIFNVAERPYSTSNFLSSVYTDYDGLSAELSNRSGFVGEYSVFSTIRSAQGNITQVWKELLKRFTATEITLPEKIDELPDIDLTRIRRNINEELWIQVVHSRQIKPPFTEEISKHFIKILDIMKQDFDVLLSDAHKHTEDREHLVRSMMHETQDNIMRLAQSFARSDDRIELSMGDFKKARNLTVDNFGGLINHPEFKNIKIFMEQKKRDSTYSAIQTEIINHPGQTTNEIYEAMKSTSMFEDIYGLQYYLDWLHKKGLVAVDASKKYWWTGKSN